MPRLGCSMKRKEHLLVQSEQLREVWERWLVWGNRSQRTWMSGSQMEPDSLIFSQGWLKMVRTRGMISLLGDPAWASPERCGAIWGSQNLIVFIKPYFLRPSWCSAPCLALRDPQGIGGDKHWWEKELSLHADVTSDQ